MKLCKWSAALVLGWGGLWAASLVEAEEPVHQMLPLAVGNSWHYQHYATEEGDGRIETFATICITHTEDIDGHTYHVFSNMPYEAPPVPDWFIAGKKVRWEGKRLLFRQQDGDLALYQFLPTPGRFPSYTIPELGADSLVVVREGEGGFSPVIIRSGPDAHNLFPYSELPNTFGFYFGGPKSSGIARKNEGRAGFEGGFGLRECVANTPAVSLFLVSALINGVRLETWTDPTAKRVATQVEHTDHVPCPDTRPVGGPPPRNTTIQEDSWGSLKRKCPCHEGED